MAYFFGAKPPAMRAAACAAANSEESCAARVSSGVMPSATAVVDDEEGSPRREDASASARRSRSNSARSLAERGSDALATARKARAVSARRRGVPAMPPCLAFREAARRGENPRGAGARAAAAATARITAEAVPALFGEPKRVVSMRRARRRVCRGATSATSGGGGFVEVFALFATAGALFTASFRARHGER